MSGKGGCSSQGPLCPACTELDYRCGMRICRGLSTSRVARCLTSLLYLSFCPVTTHRPRPRKCRGPSNHTRRRQRHPWRAPRACSAPLLSLHHQAASICIYQSSHSSYQVVLFVIFYSRKQMRSVIPVCVREFARKTGRWVDANASTRCESQVERASTLAPKPQITVQAAKTRSFTRS